MDKQEKDWYEQAGKVTKNMEDPYKRKVDSGIGAIGAFLLILGFIILLSFIHGAFFK